MVNHIYAKLSSSSAGRPIPTITIDHSTASRAINQTKRHVKSTSNKPIKPAFNKNTTIVQAPDSHQLDSIDDQLRYLRFDELREQHERAREHRQQLVIEAEMRRRDVMNLPHEAPFMSADHARIARLYAQPSYRRVNDIHQHQRSASMKSSVTRAPLKRSASNKPSYHDALRLHADAVINEHTGRYAHQPDQFTSSDPSSSSLSKPWKSWRRGPGTSSSSNEDVHIDVESINQPYEAPHVEPNQPMIVTIKPIQWKDYQLGDKSLGKARIRPRIVQDAASFRAERRRSNKQSINQSTEQHEFGAFDAELDAEVSRRQRISQQIQHLEHHNEQAFTRSVDNVVNHHTIDDTFYTSPLIRPTASSASGRPVVSHSINQLINQPHTSLDPEHRQTALERDISAYRRRLIDDLAHIDNLRRLHQSKSSSFHPRSYRQSAHELDQRSADTQRRLEELDHLHANKGDASPSQSINQQFNHSINDVYQPDHESHIVHDRDPAFITSTATVRAEPISRRPRTTETIHVHHNDEPLANRSINHRNLQLRFPHNQAFNQSSNCAYSPNTSFVSSRSSHDHELSRDIDDMMAMLSERANHVARTRICADQHLEIIINQSVDQSHEIDDIVARYSISQSIDDDVEPRNMFAAPQPIDRSQVNWIPQIENRISQSAINPPVTDQPVPYESIINQSPTSQSVNNQSLSHQSVSIVNVTEDDSDYDFDCDSVALREEDLT